MEVKGGSEKRSDFLVLVGSGSCDLSNRSILKMRSQKLKGRC